MGISAGKNTGRLYGPIRNVYGTHKVFPDIAAEPYVMTSGDIQTLYAIYDFGYGEIDLSNIKIGNTDIYAYTDEFKVHQNYTNAPLTHYMNDNSVEYYSAEIKDPVERTCAAGTEELMVDIKDPSSEFHSETRKEYIKVMHQAFHLIQEGVAAPDAVKTAVNEIIPDDERRKELMNLVQANAMLHLLSNLKKEDNGEDTKTT